MLGPAADPDPGPDGDAVGRCCWSAEVVVRRALSLGRWGVVAACDALVLGMAAVDGVLVLGLAAPDEVLGLDLAAAAAVLLPRASSSMANAICLALSVTTLRTTPH